LTTYGTPWAELPRQGCGWWIPLERLTEELDAALSMTPAVLGDMGRQGRTWALNSFGWEGIGSRMIKAYQWLTTGGPPPTNLECLP